MSGPASNGPDTANGGSSKDPTVGKQTGRGAGSGGGARTEVVELMLFVPVDSNSTGNTILDRAAILLFGVSREVLQQRKISFSVAWRDKPGLTGDDAFAKVLQYAREGLITAAPIPFLRSDVLATWMAIHGTSRPIPKEYADDKGASSLKIAESPEELKALAALTVIPTELQPSRYEPGAVDQKLGRVPRENEMKDYMATIDRMVDLTPGERERVRAALDTRLNAKEDGSDVYARAREVTEEEIERMEDDIKRRKAVMKPFKVAGKQSDKSLNTLARSWMQHKLFQKSFTLPEYRKDVHEMWADTAAMYGLSRPRPIELDGGFGHLDQACNEGGFEDSEALERALVSILEELQRRVGRIAYDTLTDLQRQVSTLWETYKAMDEAVLFAPLAKLVFDLHQGVTNRGPELPTKGKTIETVQVFDQEYDALARKHPILSLPGVRADVMSVSWRDAGTLREDVLSRLSRSGNSAKDTREQLEKNGALVMHFPVLVARGFDELGIEKGSTLFSLLVFEIARGKHRKEALAWSNVASGLLGMMAIIFAPVMASPPAHLTRSTLVLVGVGGADASLRAWEDLQLSSAVGDPALARDFELNDIPGAMDVAIELLPFACEFLVPEMRAAVIGGLSSILKSAGRIPADLVERLTARGLARELAARVRRRLINGFLGWKSQREVASSARRVARAVPAGERGANVTSKVGKSLDSAQKQAEASFQGKLRRYTRVRVQTLTEGVPVGGRLFDDALSIEIHATLAERPALREAAEDIVTSSFNSAGIKATPAHAYAGELESVVRSGQNQFAIKGDTLRRAEKSGNFSVIGNINAENGFPKALSAREAAKKAQKAAVEAELALVKVQKAKKDAMLARRALDQAESSVESAGKIASLRKELERKTEIASKLAQEAEAQGWKEIKARSQTLTADATAAERLSVNKHGDALREVAAVYEALGHAKTQASKVGSSVKVYVGDEVEGLIRERFRSLMSADGLAAGKGLTLEQRFTPAGLAQLREGMDDAAISELVETFYSKAKFKNSEAVVETVLANGKVEYALFEGKGADLSASLGQGGLMGGKLKAAAGQIPIQSIILGKKSVSGVTMVLPHVLEDKWRLVDGVLEYCAEVSADGASRWVPWSHHSPTPRVVMVVDGRHPKFP